MDNRFVDSLEVLNKLISSSNCFIYWQDGSVTRDSTGYVTFVYILQLQIWAFLCFLPQGILGEVWVSVL